MEQTPSAIVAHLLQRFPEPLVGARARAALARVASACPQHAASYYVETRLQPDAQQTDYLYSVTADQRWRFADAAHTLAESNHGTAAWRTIARYCDVWCTPESASWDVPAVWLELDDIASVKLPEPSLCVCLLSEYRSAQAPVARSDGDSARLLEAATTIRGALDPAMLALLRRCYATLPRDATLIHASFMLGRTPSVLKLYGAAPADSLWPYLAGLGHDAEGARLALSRAYHGESPLDVVYFDLALEDDGRVLASYLGLASSQQHLISGRRLEGQDGTLRRLVEEGLLDFAQADALAAWPGEERCLFAGQTFPTRLRRWLDLKLVWRADAPLALKAYLGFSARASLF